MVGRCLRLAAASVVVAVLVYLAFVCTPTLQPFGDDILVSRLQLNPDLRVSTQTALMLLTVRSLLALALGVALVALLRRRRRLAFGVAVGVLGTAVVAEVAKAVLPRPDFGVDSPAVSANSLPSGHASIAMALALAVVMVAPVTWRPRVALLGGAGAAFVSAGVIVAGWHRPADVLSADLLALAIAAVVCAAVIAAQGDQHGDTSSPEPTPHRWSHVTLAVMVPLVAALALGAVLPGRLELWRAGADVAVGLVAAVLAAVCSVLLFVRTLGVTDLDPVTPQRARC